MRTTELEQSRLERVAAEFRNRGYTVFVQPRSDEVPPFLAGLEPDLIATSRNDKVVVEVKARGGDASEVRKIADAVSRQPDWRFELIVVSVPVAPDVPETAQLAADAQIREYLNTAALLTQEGHVEAATLLAWSALEAILRKRARSEGLDTVRQSSTRVLKNLYSLGRLDPATYEKLLRFMEFRNALAHGFESGERPNVNELIAHIRQLQTAA